MFLFFLKEKQIPVSGIYRTATLSIHEEYLLFKGNTIVNSYHKLSIDNLELEVSGAPLYNLHKRIQLRIVPDKTSGLSEVRFCMKMIF